MEKNWRQNPNHQETRVKWTLEQAVIGSNPMRIADLRSCQHRQQRPRPGEPTAATRQWCTDAGHTVMHEYVDHESGRKNAKGRKQFAQLFEDAHKRKFDCVLFWALDRFTREGMTPTIGYLQRLASYGVSFHSYTEAHLSTDNELVGNILLAVMSSLAKVKSQKIGERTRAGMARARGPRQTHWPSRTRSSVATENCQAVGGRTERLCRGKAARHRCPHRGKIQPFRRKHRRTMKKENRQ